MLASNSAEALHDPGSDSGDAVARGARAPRVEVRWAKADDVTEFFGRPHHGTMRAVVAVLDGKVRGICGVVREGPVGKFFADFHEELRPYLKTVKIMRAVKLGQRMCENYRGPLVAIAETAEGCRILHRLGFTHLTGDLYGWLR